MDEHEGKVAILGKDSGLPMDAERCAQTIVQSMVSIVRS
jgi:hypothetical protein